MSRVKLLLDTIRHSFWVLPGLGILFGIGAGRLVPALDDSIRLPDGLAPTGGPDTAQAVLQVIATVAVSVAGISFSVIVVALVLASQQLSPRVIRSFQRHPLNQAVLGLFLGTAAYAVYVLGAIDVESSVPELSVGLAMLLTGVSLALFVVFLHHMVRSLNASAVIRRIAADGHLAVDMPYPNGFGEEPEDAAAAEHAASQLVERGAATDVCAQRAGYVATLKADLVVAAARDADAFVAQRVQIGDFAVTGAVLATIWCRDGERDELAAEVLDAFVLNEERLVDDDVAFPTRQLADVALKGLSPSLNDPTTAENAMDSVADTLVRFARQPAVSLLRTDASGTPRLRAKAPDLGHLVLLGFDQVRRHGASQPSFAIRLLELLAAIRDQGGDVARGCAEIDRQARLVAAEARELATLQEDADAIARAYERLHGAGRAPAAVS